MGRKSPKQEDAIGPDDVRLGRVSGVFGVAGEVRLFLHNRDTELFSGNGIVVTLVSPDGERFERSLRTRRGAGKRVLGRLDGVDTPELARALIDHEIVVHASALPSPGSDEYYHRDLIGLDVHTADGELVGTLREVMEGPVVDCWVVDGPSGEVMFPAISEIVVAVDIGKGITIAEAIREYGD